MSKQPRRAEVGVATSVIGTQAGIAVAAAAAAYGVGGKQAAFAAAYGGLTALVPTVYFALRVFAQRDPVAPGDVVGAFYRAEVGRFGLTVAMFFVGVAVFAKQFLPMMLSYMSGLLAYWVVMARSARAG